MQKSFIKATAILFGSLFFQACGDDPVFIADSVRFKIYFEERIAEMEFILNPDYQTTLSTEETFHGLAYIELKKSDQQSLNVLSFIDPQVLAQNWPFIVRSKLPSKDPLPRPYEQSWIYEWPGSTASYLLSEQNGLSIGALYQSVEFNQLPPGFLAVQEILGEDKRLKASIALFGPRSQTDGGLLVIGHLGKNPFESDTQTVPETNTEVEFKANTSAKIVSLGNFGLRHIWSLKSSAYKP